MVLEILKKTDFKTVYKNLLQYEVEDKIIIVNPINVRWILLTMDEYYTYTQLINDSILDNNKSYNLIMKLIVHNLIQFKNNITTPRFIVPKINIYYAPTPYCNLKCVYCYAEAESPVAIKNFSTDTKKSYNLIDHMISDNTDTIYFTGGEPTLRKDIFALVNYVKSKGVRVGILTNGININEKTSIYYKIFDKITISLDASYAELNDITRGKGSFNKIVSGIRYLKSQGLNVAITSVISKVNFNNVPSLLKFVYEDLGITSHKLSLYISHGRAKDKSSIMELSYDEIILFRNMYIDFLIRTNNKTNIISLLQPPLQQGIKRYVCGIGSSEIFVDNDGNVFPCRLFEKDQYILGNITEKHISDVINNSSTKCFQEKLCVDNITDCKNCNVRYICGGGCRSSHACYTKDINKSNISFCDVIKYDIKSSILLSMGYNPLNMKKI